MGLWETVLHVPWETVSGSHVPYIVGGWFMLQGLRFVDGLRVGVTCVHRAACELAALLSSFEFNTTTCAVVPQSWYDRTVVQWYAVQNDPNQAFRAYAAIHHISERNAVQRGFGPTRKPRTGWF